MIWIRCMLAALSVLRMFPARSFHCCFNASEVYYEEWYSSKECRQYALLHPVKLTSAIWGSQNTSLFHSYG